MSVIAETLSITHAWNRVAPQAPGPVSSVFGLASGVSGRYDRCGSNSDLINAIQTKNLIYF